MDVDHSSSMSPTVVDSNMDCHPSPAMATAQQQQQPTCSMQQRRLQSYILRMKQKSFSYCCRCRSSDASDISPDIPASAQAQIQIQIHLLRCLDDARRRMGHPLIKLQTNHFVGGLVGSILQSRMAMRRGYGLQGGV